MTQRYQCHRIIQFSHFLRDFQVVNITNFWLMSLCRHGIMLVTAKLVNLGDDASLVPPHQLPNLLTWNFGSHGYSLHFGLHFIQNMIFNIGIQRSHYYKQLLRRWIVMYYY